MTPLNQITQLGVGCGLGSTQVEVRAFVKTIPFQSRGRQSVFHIFKIADPDTGFECEAKFWGRDARDIPVRQIIEIAEPHNSKRPGLTVGEDRDGNAQLSVSESCEISFIGDSPQRQHAPQQQRNYQQQPQQRQPAPQQRQNHQQPQQRAQPPQRPAPINGQTVGMAINNACNLIAKFGADPSTSSGLARDYLLSPKFSSDLWTIASDIMRVSGMIESGKWADPAKIRNTPRQPQHQSSSQPDLPPDSEVTRPLNRQPANRQPQNVDDFGEGPITDMGLDGDDIPF